LKHTEQVLENEPVSRSSLGDSNNTIIMEEIDRKFTALLVQNQTMNEVDSVGNLIPLRGLPKLFRSSSGINVPSMNMNQMDEAIQLCQLIGLTKDRLIECGGSQCAVMIMNLLGGSRRIHPKNEYPFPTVVVLVSDSQKGAFGLSAARHLANHEVKVHVFQLGDLLREDIRKELQLFRSTSGKLSHGFKDISYYDDNPVDMIVDALFDSNIPSILQLFLPFQMYLDWANSHAVPVLSLDYPSGVHGSHGGILLPLLGEQTEDQPMNRMLCPKWIACLGLPKSGLLILCEVLPLLASSQFFLIDIGIPSLILKKLGVLTPTGLSPYLSDRFLIPLELHSVLPMKLSP
jgi:enhancer of mRNA-decapping protein 3